MISFAVHFLRHRDHREGTCSNAYFATLAAFGVDHDITSNFCHMMGFDLLTDSHRAKVQNIV
jgi:hypothetical protein